MKVTKTILGLGFSIFLFGCGPSAEKKAAQEKSITEHSEKGIVGNEPQEEPIVTSDIASNESNEEVVSSLKKEKSSDNDFISSSAAIENNKDTTRKFIRTADLKFKVKSVIKSTLIIENIANKQEGFVSYTNLESAIDNVTSTVVSADSSLETTYYTVKNTLTIRIPNTKLDTTLKEISRNIDYLDFRIIKAEDVSLSILKSKLAQKRLAINASRTKKAIEKAGKKLNDITEAEDALLNRQEQADNETLSNLSLLDRINFSTINLSIYQRQTIKRELISNDKNIDAYEPSFGSKILEALKFGWNILEAFLIFLAKLWGLLLFGLVAYFIYKKYGHKLKK